MSTPTGRSSHSSNSKQDGDQSGAGRGDNSFSSPAPSDRVCQVDSDETNSSTLPAEVAGADSLNILLVDDHEDTLRVMSRLLNGLRYRVTTATGVDDALLAADRESFDLLISDLGLEDGSGLDLMRELLRRRPIRGIALTGYDSDDSVRQAREAGFVAHVVKPVDFERLHAVICEVGKANP